MRLPWPFTLLKRAPAAEAAAAPSPRAGPEPRAGDEWLQLPPITEAIGPPPLIAPTAPFAADLGAGKPPPPALAPLSHARGLDAPSGIILGVARPVQRVADSGTRPLLQRRPARHRASLAPERRGPGRRPPPHGTPTVRVGGPAAWNGRRRAPCIRATGASPSIGGRDDGSAEA